VNSLANGALNLAFRTARAHLVKHAVLTINTPFQLLANSIQAAFGSDYCSDTKLEMGHLRYCSLFENEMLQVQTTYCRRAQRIFNTQAECANVPESAPSLVVDAPADARAQHPADSDCSIAAIRYRLRNKGLLTAISPTRATTEQANEAVNADSQPERSSSSHSSLPAAEWAARDQLLTQYLADIDTVRSRVKTGFDYAEAICRLALAHQQLYDFIVKSPDASTAILDR
jgi:hypothetical protein